MTAPLNDVRRITRSGSSGNHLWAIMDQGIVSSGSALTSVLLARSLRPEQFGVVVLLIAGMLFLNTVHASLVVYPLSVQGARLPDARFRSYLMDALFSTLFLTAPLSLLLGVAAAAVAPGSAVVAVLGLIAWQFQETTRRALFARLRHGTAITGDLLSYSGQAVAVGLLGVTGNLTVSSVFVAIAVTSLIGGVVQALQLRPLLINTGGLIARSMSVFSSGRWTLPSNLLGAVVMQLPIWMLGMLQARADVGKFQALIVLAGVANPIMFGVANMVTPAVARLRADPAGSSVARLLATSVKHGAALLLPIMVILWIWPAQILGQVFGRSSPYTNLTTPLRVLTFAYLLVFLAHVGNAALFGMERPRDVLRVQLVGVAVLLAVGIPATAFWGVFGTIFAVLLVHATRTLVCGRALERSLRTVTPRPIVALEGS